MITASRFFFSAPVTDSHYLYIQFPFAPSSRSEIHILDHIFARRLDQIPQIRTVRCETESGIDVLSVEMQLDTPITINLIDEIFRMLFAEPITEKECKTERVTAQIEVMQDFLRKDVLYPHMYDYRCKTVDDLLRVYRDQTNITVEKLETVRGQLGKSPAYVIASVNESTEPAAYLVRVFTNRNTLTYEDERRLYKIAKHIDWRLQDRDMVYVKKIFRLPIQDALAYEKAVLVFGVLHDAIVDELMKRGLGYDGRLMVNPTCYGVSDFILAYRTLPELVDDSKYIVRTMLREPVVKLDPQGEFTVRIVNDTGEYIEQWLSNPIQKDYNRAWQYIVFGEENYKSPELIESVFKSVTTKKLDQFNSELSIGEPICTMHIGEKL
jgi:hypothetical protein